MTSLNKPENGHIAQPKGKPIYKFIEINGRIEQVHSVIVKRIEMGDTEDPDLFVGQPIWEWQQTEMGKWVMKKSIETPMWHRNINTMTFGHTYAIQAWLAGKDYTYWHLKWGHELDKKQ